MNESEQSGDIIELSELYDLLEKDARLLVKDFDEGVGMWRLTGTLLLYYSVVGLVLLATTISPVTPVGNWRILALIGASGLVAAGLVGFVFARRKYGQLRKKYTDLFKAAKKLS